MATRPGSPPAPDSVEALLDDLERRYGGASNPHRAALVGDIVGTVRRLDLLGAYAQGISEQITRVVGGVLIAARAAVRSPEGDTAAFDRLREMLATLHACDRATSAIASAIGREETDKQVADIFKVLHQARERIWSKVKGLPREGLDPPVASRLPESIFLSRES